MNLEKRIAPLGMSLMNELFDLSMPYVFIDAHGVYPKKDTFTTVPTGMTIIETALPTQDTFASIYKHLHALLVDPKPLVYLFDPDMKIDTPLKNDNHQDKVIALQQAILKGDYDAVIALIVLGYAEDAAKKKLEDPAKDPKVLRKLEELESIVQSLTVYKAGDPIYSRELSFFDDTEKDITCSLTMSEGIVLRADGFKATIDTIAGTTTTAIVTELKTLNPLKLIIMSCGHVGKELEGFKLANKIMPIRQNFWAERSIAGPTSTHILSQDAYSTHEWCLNGITLTKIIKDVAPESNANLVATENHEFAKPKHVDEEDNFICSSDYKTRLSQFIYINTGGELTKVKEDTYTIKPVDNPFIITTLDKLILTYNSIIQNLYLIDKSTMNLIKVTDILQGLLDPSEIVFENVDLINIYMGSFAKYILNKYHMPSDRKEERSVPSFSEFKNALGKKIKESIRTWKFSTKMEKLDNIMRNLNNFTSFQDLEIVVILKTNAAILSTKDNSVVLALIEKYREYLGEDIQYWVKTKLGLDFKSLIDYYDDSEDPDTPALRAIQDQMKAKSEGWRSTLSAKRAKTETPSVIPNSPNGPNTAYADKPKDGRKRPRAGGFRITRKKRSRKGRKTHARRRRSRSSLR